MHFLFALGILAVGAPTARYDHSAYAKITLPNGLVNINVVLAPDEDFCPESGDPAQIRWGATTHLVSLYDAGNPASVSSGPYFSVDPETSQQTTHQWGVADKRAQGWRLGQLKSGGNAPPAGMLSASGTAVVAFDDDVLRADAVFFFADQEPLVGSVTAKHCPALDAFYQDALQGQ